MKKTVVSILAATLFFASCSGTSKTGKVIGIKTADSKDTASQRKFSQRLLEDDAIVTVATADDTVEAIAALPANKDDKKRMPAMNQQSHHISNKLNNGEYLVRN